MSMMRLARCIEPGSVTELVPYEMPAARAACMISETTLAREVMDFSSLGLFSSILAIRSRQV